MSDTLNPKCRAAGGRCDCSNADTIIQFDIKPVAEAEPLASIATDPRFMELLDATQGAMPPAERKVAIEAMTAHIDGQLGRQHQTIKTLMRLNMHLAEMAATLPAPQPAPQPVAAALPLEDLAIAVTSASQVAPSMALPSRTHEQHLEHKPGQEAGGQGNMSWIRPTCSCGWKGGQYFAYNDCQFTSMRDAIARHLREVEQETRHA